MINSTFTDTFNFLVNSLNNLSKLTKDQKAKSEALNRMLDSVQFIYDKQKAFTLESLREELVQLKTEATKLKNQVPNSFKNSLVFVAQSLIDSLIMEIDSEIEKKKNQATPPPSNNQNIKVKVFKSAFAHEVEKEMNLFLGKNPKIQIVNTLQNIDGGVVCITIFYKN